MAKALGFIHTPLIIEAIPFVGGFIALLGVVKKLGEYTAKISRAILDIGEMKVEIKGIREDIHSLDKRVSVVETTMLSLDRRVGLMESKI